MRTICLYFEIHQIIHLKRYRFFNIVSTKLPNVPIFLH